MSRNNKSNADSLDTLFAQLDGAIDPQTGGVVPPIQSSTTFVRDEEYNPLSADHVYSRDQNDLLRLGEKILTKSEHGEDGLLLPSGMAAVASVLRTVPNNGRIIMQSGIYWGVTKWARDFCARRAIELIEVDCSNLAALTSIAKSADILWIETPSNPYLKTSDISECAKIAKSIGAALVVDSTAATPVLTQPLDHGADIVMHSATKAINGHSDVLAGYLGCRDASTNLWQQVKADRHEAGAMLGSFEAWLLIRGMRTLPLRMERMSQNAMEMANFLTTHPKIEKVLYPGLPTDMGHATAKKQMDGGFGSLLSIQVKGGKSAALDAVGKMKLFKRATSLGGVESLVEHRHTIENTVPENLIRLSLGIENSTELMNDVDNALT